MRTWISVYYGSNVGFEYSTDGLNWITTLTEAYYIREVRKGNGLWVVASEAGLYYSTDLTNWTLSNIRNGSGGGTVHYGNGLWVAAGMSYGAPTVLYSTDGKVWSAGNSSGKGFKRIHFANGIWVATTNMHTRDDAGIYYSTDGINWNASNITNDYDIHYHRQILYENGLWFVESQACIYTSADGMNWNATLVRSDIFGNSIHGSHYADGIWVVLNNEGTYDYSTDCVNWTNVHADDRPECICYGNGLWVMGFSTTGLFYSTDLINWTASNIATGLADWVVYDSGLWLALVETTPYSSTDGMNWTAVRSPSSTHTVYVISDTGEAGFKKWSWEKSNGTATDAETQAAYLAVTNKQPTTNFSYKVWNDLINKVKLVGAADGIDVSKLDECLATEDNKILYLYNYVTGLKPITFGLDKYSPDYRANRAPYTAAQLALIDQNSVDIWNANDDVLMSGAYVYTGSHSRPVNYFVAYTLDHQTWVYLDGSIRNIINYKGIFIGVRTDVENDSKQYLCHSSNLVDWEDIDIAYDLPPYSDVEYGVDFAVINDVLFMALRNGLYFSTDGRSWTKSITATNITTSYLQNTIRYSSEDGWTLSNVDNAGGFCGGSAMFSKDLITWTSCKDSPNTFGSRRRYYKHEELYISAGIYGGLTYSTDGITWESIPMFQSIRLVDVIYFYGNWYVLAEDGKTYKSQNGIDWVEFLDKWHSLDAITICNNMCFFIGIDLLIIMPDGTYTFLESPFQSKYGTGYPWHLIYNRGVYNFHYPDGGTSYISCDLKTFIPAYAPYVPNTTNYADDYISVTVGGSSKRVYGFLFTGVTQLLNDWIDQVNNK